MAMQFCVLIISFIHIRKKCFWIISPGCYSDIWVLFKLCQTFNQLSNQRLRVLHPSWSADLGSQISSVYVCVHVCVCVQWPSSVSDSMDSVTWLVLLRESVDWERYRRPLMGISSNTGLKGEMIIKYIFIFFLFHSHSQTHTHTD